MDALHAIPLQTTKGPVVWENAHFIYARCRECTAPLVFFKRPGRWSDEGQPTSHYRWCPMGA